MAGVSRDVASTDMRCVSGISDSPLYKVHSTTADTGDVMDVARTEVHSRVIVSPAVTFPDCSWETSTLVEAGTVWGETQHSHLIHVIKVRSTKESQGICYNIIHA